MTAVQVEAREAEDFSRLFANVFLTGDIKLRCIDGEVACHLEVLDYWSSFIALKAKKAKKKKLPLYLDMTTYEVSQMIELMYLGCIIVDETEMRSFCRSFEIFIEQMHIPMALDYSAIPPA